MAKLLKHIRRNKKIPEIPEPDYPHQSKSTTAVYDEVFCDYGTTTSNTDYECPFVTATSTIPSPISPPRRSTSARSPSFEPNKDTTVIVNPDTTSPSHHKKPVIMEDYSIPLDVKNLTDCQKNYAELGLGQGSLLVEQYDDDDYMVPYDSRILEDLKREERKDRKVPLPLLQAALTTPAAAGDKKVHIYEEPYEEPYEGDPSLEPNNNNDSKPAAATEESGGAKHQTPEADSRPGEEYEVPWEWKNRLAAGVLGQGQGQENKENGDSGGSGGGGGGNRLSQSGAIKDQDRSSRQFAGVDQQQQQQQRLSQAGTQQVRENDGRPGQEYEVPWEWAARKKMAEKILEGIQRTEAEVSQWDESDGRSPTSTPSSSSSSISPKRNSTGSMEKSSPKKPPRTDLILKQQQQQQQQQARRSDKVEIELPFAAAAASCSLGKKASGLKLDIRPKSELLTETFNPCLPLGEQRWYHGKLSRNEAEDILRTCKECSYLVRQSESGNPKDFSLSLKSARGFMHMKIVCKAEAGFILGEFSQPFEDIPSMIDFYTRNKLNIKGAEHMMLRFPVYSRLL